MDARLQRRVQRYGWDRAADHYERFWAAQLAPAQERLLARAAIRPGERVLDVACGTGLVTCAAARATGPAGAVLATDISERMVQATAAAASAAGLSHVSSERHDAESLAVAPGAFDVALCALGLMYVPDAVRALGQMRTALRPGGRAVAAVWGARNRCGWAEIFPIVDARVESEVCPLFFQLGTGETLARTFEAAGFTEVTTERLDTLLDYGSEEDALGAAFVGGPVALAYSRFDDRTRDEAHAEYLASIERYRTNGRYHIPGEFIVTAGCVP